MANTAYANKGQACPPCLAYRSINCLDNNVIGLCRGLDQGRPLSPKGILALCVIVSVQTGVGHNLDGDMASTLDRMSATTDPDIGQSCQIQADAGFPTMENPMIEMPSV